MVVRDSTYRRDYFAVAGTFCSNCGKTSSERMIDLDCSGRDTLGKFLAGSRKLNLAAFSLRVTPPPPPLPVSCAVAHLRGFIDRRPKFTSQAVGVFA